MIVNPVHVRLESAWLFAEASARRFGPIGAVRLESGTPVALRRRRALDGEWVTADRAVDGWSIGPLGCLLASVLGHCDVRHGVSLECSSIARCCIGGTVNVSPVQHHEEGCRGLADARRPCA